jgi:hypothetical protein
MATDTSTVEIPAALRPVLLATAKNLLVHLYGPEGPAWGTPFADLEELAVRISQALGSELLGQALQRQAQQPVPPPLQTCPVCSGPLSAKPPEPRSVTTRIGFADWQEPASQCDRCRKAFFPAVQESGH